MHGIRPEIGRNPVFQAQEGSNFDECRMGLARRTPRATAGRAQVGVIAQCAVGCVRGSFIITLHSTVTPQRCQMCRGCPVHQNRGSVPGVSRDLPGIVTAMHGIRPEIGRIPVFQAPGGSNFDEFRMGGRRTVRRERRSAAARRRGGRFPRAIRQVHLPSHCNLPPNPPRGTILDRIVT